MQPLSIEETETVELVAEKIIGLGLQNPILFMLDAASPVAFLGSQLLWVAQPAASLLVSSGAVKRLAVLLEKPSALSALKHQLEKATG